MQAFFQNGDEQANGDGAPDLGADRVGRRAIKGFDAQMLFEPFEESFNLPAATIPLGDVAHELFNFGWGQNTRKAGFGNSFAPDPAPKI